LRFDDIQPLSQIVALCVGSFQSDALEFIRTHRDPDTHERGATPTCVDLACQRAGAARLIQLMPRCIGSFRFRAANSSPLRPADTQRRSVCPSPNTAGELPEQQPADGGI
jgi:hypothetical protein